MFQNVLPETEEEERRETKKDRALFLVVWRVPILSQLESTGFRRPG